MREEIASQVRVPETSIAEKRSDIQNRWTLTVSIGGGLLALGGSLVAGEPLSYIAHIDETIRPVFQIGFSTVSSILGGFLGIGMGASLGQWQADRSFPIKRPHYPLPKSISFIAIER